MRVMLLPVVLLATIHGAGARESGGCQSSALPAGSSAIAVAIKQEMTPPYFYYRSFDYNYVVVVSEKSVTSALDARASGGSKTASGLATLVRKDLPLPESADLFRYVLKDPYYFSLIQWILVDLLDRGDAAVMNAPIGNFISKVTVKRSNTKGGSSREFLGPNRELILAAIDCIQN